jgi:signal transduction protein with GAF and PtsI domain
MDMLSNKKQLSLKISESKLKERNRELSIFQEMSNLLSDSMDLNKMLAVAFSKPLEYFDLEAGRIYLIDDTNKRLYLAAHRGMKIRGLENLSFDEGFSGKASRSGLDGQRHKN